MIQKVREAIFEVFGNYISDDSEEAKKIIEESTYTGEDDPGGWSPRAAVIIHCESGIPSGLFDEVYDKWFEVSDKLKTHYCEHINEAVIAVHEV